MSEADGALFIFLVVSVAAIALIHAVNYRKNGADCQYHHFSSTHDFRHLTVSQYANVVTITEYRCYNCDHAGCDFTRKSRHDSMTMTRHKLWKRLKAYEKIHGNSS